MTGDESLRSSKLQRTCYRIIMSSSKAALVIDQARQYIRANVSRSGLRVDDIANYCGVSRRVLERRFRELLGRSPLEEILDIKIRCAKVLLESTSLSVTAISRHLGFADVKSLRLHFRTNEGMPPGKWRRRQSPHATSQAHRLARQLVGN